MTDYYFNAEGALLPLFEFIIKRLISAVPVLLGVTICIFVISHSIAGDPALMIAGPRANQETLDEIRRLHGLDRPLYEQYIIYMKNLVQGDLGQSIRNQRPVTQDLKIFFPATLELSLAAMLICLCVGIPLGIFAAANKRKLADHLTRIFSVIGVSTPVFWLGLMLLLLLYSSWDLLPGSGRLSIYYSAPPNVTGMYTIDALLAGDWSLLRNALSHIILPAFCLSYVYLAIITRIVRSSMIDVLGQDYITTARANGISGWNILTKHAFKNSLIPTITIVGVSFGELLGGAILTETIFNWPGMGKYVVDSANYLDYPAIMAFALVAASAYVFINLIVDVLYALVNPQIRY